jgi:hypothetical protein
MLAALAIFSIPWSVSHARSQALPAVTEVRTPQRFAAAIAAGDANIRVLEHMDLRSLTGEVLCPDGTCAGNVVLRVQPSTKSIVVRLHALRILCKRKATTRVLRLLHFLMDAHDAHLRWSITQVRKQLQVHVDAPCRVHARRQCRPPSAGHPLSQRSQM